MKSWFVIPAVAISLVLAALSLVQAATLTEERWAWLGAAVANLPLPLFIAWLNRGGIARTSDNLPLLLLVSAAGLTVAAWQSFIDARADWLATGVAVLGILLLLLYVFWYSRFGRLPNARLAVGNKLPEFELADLEGNAWHSRDLAGKPSVLLFHQGNWCPVCMAQLRELAQRAGELEQLDFAYYVVTSQPEDKTRELAAEMGDRLRFLVDRDNRVAESLDIDEPDGVPARARREYAGDTVMPTVIATSVSGTILYSDETDNYRVRPEPDVYLSILRRAVAAAA